MRTASPLKLALTLSLLCPVLLAGCQATVEPAVAVGPPGVGIDPGYYYDEEYVDVGGVHHPRDYWYHDEHGWAHRDGIPQGHAARDRATVGYVRGGESHEEGGHAEGGHDEGGHDGGGHR